MQRQYRRFPDDNKAILMRHRRQLMSFIMSYLYNNQRIDITLPIAGISINKRRMAISHNQGKSYIEFANNADMQGFMQWLKGQA